MKDLINQQQRLDIVILQILADRIVLISGNTIETLTQGIKTQILDIHQPKDVHPIVLLIKGHPEHSVYLLLAVLLIHDEK